MVCRALISKVTRIHDLRNQGEGGSVSICVEDRPHWPRSLLIHTHTHTHCEPDLFHRLIPCKGYF